MNSYPININSRTRSIRKTLQGQLYLDKSNLFFVPTKKTMLHHAKHKFIQNIMAAESNLDTS